LERPFTELPDEKRVRLAYLESHAAVEYLVERYDWSGVRRLLEGLANGVSIEAALGAVELDYRGLEEAVERWVAGRL
jgi:hypothetical protein